VTEPHGKTVVYVFSTSPEDTATAAIAKVRDKIRRGFWQRRADGKPRDAFVASDVHEA
jgi:hypothetical protein